MTSPISKPAARRRRTRLDEADPRGVLGTAEGHEQGGENHERENEIGDRSRGDDRRAIEQRLAGERRARAPPG